MIDPFERYARPHPGTFDHALAITPDDDNDLPIIPSMMWLGTPGDVRITAVNGETVTFKNANLLPFLFSRAKRIHATGTTASDIILCW
ncbi:MULTISPECIES: spike base protein, RCAP_Rcc01079 family [Rhizobium]|uniref:spike base protein, RCAP_Rcc01079 family n=1 Tax=Rhizobium TaxID=379 RepID=UPI0010318C41|nr:MULTISPECIES: hypothetical protein [Rhizobium]MBY3493871.1 hypothetical protein [Rhizobium laguerreae]TBH58573.1 hypothetical protein ELG65_09195 [Rhizobium leguminosarum]